MRWKFLIMDPFSGSYKGTNSKEVADAYAVNEDFFVADVETGEWLTPSVDGAEQVERLSIEAVEAIKLSEEDGTADEEGEDDNG